MCDVSIIPPEEFLVDFNWYQTDSCRVVLNIWDALFLLIIKGGEHYGNLSSRCSS